MHIQEEPHQKQQKAQLNKKLEAIRSLKKIDYGCCPELRNVLIDAYLKLGETSDAFSTIMFYYDFYHTNFQPNFIPRNIALGDLDQLSNAAVQRDEAVNRYLEGVHRDLDYIANCRGRGRGQSYSNYNQTHLIQAQDNSYTPYLKEFEEYHDNTEVTFDQHNFAKKSNNIDEFYNSLINKIECHIGDISYEGDDELSETTILKNSFFTNKVDVADEPKEFEEQDYSENLDEYDMDEIGDIEYKKPIFQKPIKENSMNKASTSNYKVIPMNATGTTAITSTSFVKVSNSNSNSNSSC